MGQTEGEKSWELEKGMRERSEPVGEGLGSRGKVVVPRRWWRVSNVMWVCVMVCSHGSFSALCVCRCVYLFVCNYFCLLRKR